MTQRIEAEPPLLPRGRIAQHQGRPTVRDFMEHDRDDEGKDDRRDLQQSVVHAPHLGTARSEEHTSELQSLMRNSYAVFCLKKKQYTYELKKTPRQTKSSFGM